MHRYVKYGTQMHIYIYIYIYIHYVCTCMRAHTCTHARTHAHTHTNTDRGAATTQIYSGMKITLLHSKHMHQDPTCTNSFINYIHIG